jgi:hypothetical protein
MDNEEFYIGYVSEAPRRTGSFIRKTVIGIGLIICCIALILAWNQKELSASVFEYGVNTTVEGYLFTSPVPHIAIPLAEDVVDALQNKKGKSLAGSKIALKGFLIYGNGKALLQIRKEDNDMRVLLGGPTPPTPRLDSISVKSVGGEIVDPKCYFGVMKPGEGKAHRSCAIRCIAGGIPPVFHATASGEYFLLVNEKGQPMKEDVLALVGDQITLTGTEIQWNDWKMLRVNTEALKGIAQNEKLTEQLLAFREGMTQCNDKLSLQE